MSHAGLSGTVYRGSLTGLATRRIAHAAGARTTARSTVAAARRRATARTAVRAVARRRATAWAAVRAVARRGAAARRRAERTARRAAAAHRTAVAAATAAGTTATALCQRRRGAQGQSHHCQSYDFRSFHNVTPFFYLLLFVFLYLRVNTFSRSFSVAKIPLKP